MRWSEHNNRTLKSEPAQHIKTILDTCLIGLYYATPHLIAKLGKNLEPLFIGIMKPSLNEQTIFDRLTLFRNKT